MMFLFLLRLGLGGLGIVIDNVIKSWASVEVPGMKASPIRKNAYLRICLIALVDSVWDVV